MDFKEWGEACKNRTANHHWDGACRRIQQSLKYNPDPNATHRHHLMNTPEQIEYNNTHYELWGFEIDEDGNEHFEYGKYIIFVTPEEHTKIHDRSGEKNGMYGRHHSDETRARMKIINSHVASPELRKIRSENAKGENNPMYGKHHTEETKQKIRDAISGENHPMYGKHYSEEHNKHVSDALKGKKKSEDHKQHLKDAWKNRAPDSDETRMKKSIAARNRVQSEEEKKKRSESLKGKKKSEEHKQHLKESWAKRKALKLSQDQNKNE